MNDQTIQDPNQTAVPEQPQDENVTSVTTPLAPLPDPVAKTPSDTTQVVQKKIMIVEDEKPLSKALELKLKKEGFDVSVAGDGEQAIQMKETYNPDLILLDMVMPKIDGFEVLEKLQENGNTSPIVILSNLGQGEDINRAKSLGATDYLVKSNSPLALIVRKVHDILD